MGRVRPRAADLTGRNVTLKSLLVFAYRLHGSQLWGPDWIETEGYDITANANSPVTGEQLRQLLQARLPLGHRAINPDRATAARVPATLFFVGAVLTMAAVAREHGTIISHPAVDCRRHRECSRYQDAATDSGIRSVA